MKLDKSKLKPCKACANLVSPSAHTCPHCGERRPVVYRPSWRAVALTTVTAVVFALMIAAGSGTSTALKLATINAPEGVTVSKNDATVGQFQMLLNSIAEKTGERDGRIADVTYRGLEMLQEKGVRDITLLEFMAVSEGVLNEYTKPGRTVSYETAVAMTISALSR